jgi:RNA polymerase sigma-70 factor (ECF subfamily)
MIICKGELNIHKNETSLSNLVDLHSKTVYRFCYSLTNNKADADDLFQDTFLKAVNQYSKISKAGNQLNFLISICHYTWKSNKRKYARRQRIAPIEWLEDTKVISDNYNLEKQVISNELTRYVGQIVHSLKEKYRIPTYLFYNAQLLIPEIASALKIPMGTVKSRLHKARELIQKELEDAGYGK